MTNTSDTPVEAFERSYPCGCRGSGCDSGAAARAARGGAVRRVPRPGRGMLYPLSENWLRLIPTDPSWVPASAAAERAAAALTRLAPLAIDISHRVFDAVTF